jgi:hypothetical protein
VESRLRVLAGVVAAEDGGAEFTPRTGSGCGTVDAFGEVDFEMPGRPTAVVGALETRAVAGDADAVTHGVAGSTGSVHAGRSRTKAGIARCPMTAAVQTAWREAADLLRRK